MTTVDEHAAHVAALLRPAIERRRDAGAESLPIDDALGRVTATAVRSPVDLPLFRNSQMDGFAVRSADLPGTLPVVGEVSARPSDPPALRPGTAVRIMTGAVVPEANLLSARGGASASCCMQSAGDWKGTERAAQSTQRG